MATKAATKTTPKAGKRAPTPAAKLPKAKPAAAPAPVAKTKPATAPKVKPETPAAVDRTGIIGRPSNAERGMDNLEQRSIRMTPNQWLVYDGMTPEKVRAWLDAQGEKNPEIIEAGREIQREREAKKKGKK
jgi:hypothetical protein